MTQDDTQRLIAVELDQGSIHWRNADVEQERKVAIYDLLENNSFAPVNTYPNGYCGPYRLKLRVEDGRLAMDVADKDGAALETILLPLAAFRRSIREYFAICESYYKAIKHASPSQIEAIDMGRRGLHNEASKLLRERLNSKVAIDFDTARRLFTLLCVLHIR